MALKEEKRATGFSHLLTALHHNAAAVVTAKSDLNGPDQVLPSDTHVCSHRGGSVKLRRCGDKTQGLGAEEPVSVPTLLRQAAQSHPFSVALRCERDGRVLEWTYESYLRDVRLVARAFLQLGLQRHHSVAILAANSPEWVLADLAAIFAGGLSVGLMLHLPSDELAKVALDAKVDVLMVEDEAQLKRVLLIQHKLPGLKAIVEMRGEPPMSDRRRLHRSHKKHILSWPQLLELGHQLPDFKLDERLRRVAINQGCKLVYVASNQRVLRGAVFTHDNLTWTAKMLLGALRAPGFQRLPMAGEEVMVSLMHLSSVHAQTLQVYYMMSVAGTLCFVDSNQQVLDDCSVPIEELKSFRPTLFVAPSSSYELLAQSLLAQRKEMSGLSRLSTDFLSKVVKGRHLNRQQELEETGSLSKVINAVAKDAVSKRFKEKMGFNRNTLFISRSETTLSADLLKILASFDILVHESYGLTETTGLLAANIPKRYVKFGSVGKFSPGVRASISLDAGRLHPNLPSTIGELRCNGRNVFMGYLNRESETRELLDETSSLRLEVLATLDEEQFVHVQGTMLNAIVLKSGEVIFPEKVEQLIRLELPCIRHAMVVGEDETSLAALLTLKTNNVANSQSDVLTHETRLWFAQSRYDIRTVSDVLVHMERGLKHVFQAGIDRANEKCPTAAHIVSDWRIIAQQFTYENGELTVSGGLNRCQLKQSHSHCIRSLFGSDKSNICHADADLKCEAMQKHNATLSQQLSKIQEEDDEKLSSSRTSVDKTRCEEMQGSRTAATTTVVIVNAKEVDNDDNDNNDDEHNDNVCTIRVTPNRENEQSKDDNNNDYYDDNNNMEEKAKKSTMEMTTTKTLVVHQTSNNDNVEERDTRT